MTTNTQIGRAAITISVATVMTSFAGLVKNIVVGWLFGTGGEYDAFVIAFMLPTLLSGVIVSAIQVAVIPVFLEKKAQEGESNAFRVFNSFSTYALGLFLMITLLLETGATHIVPLLSPGFDADRLSLATDLSRLMAPLLLLNGGIGLAIVLLNAYRHFAVTSLSPGLAAVVTVGYIALMRQQGIYSLAFGLLVGALLQLGALLTAVLVLRFPVMPSLSWNSGTSKIARLSIPLLIGTSFSSINPAVDQIFASTLHKGSVSALNYALQFHSLIIQVTVIALSTAIFPFLSAQVIERQTAELQETFSRGARMVAFILAPLTALILVLGQPTIQFFFERGAFDHQATIVVARTWSAYSLGLISAGFAFLLARLYNALKDSKTLTLVALQDVAWNIGLDFLLMQIWREAGIALSTSLVYTINTIILIAVIQKRTRLLEWNLLLKTSRSIGLGICMAFAMTVLMSAASIWAKDSSALSAAILIAIAGAGLAIFALLAKFVRMEELTWLLGLVNRKQSKVMP